MLNSCVCTQKQLESDLFQEWTGRLQESRGRLHRKIWEWCYIAQALEERGMLQPGRRGIGFAVGQEPLTALFASRGCEVLATDLDQERAAQQGWVHTQQHASSLDHLNQREICPADLFRQRVQFRCVDMNRLPSDLGQFDFAWSSCSIEHLGSLQAGIRFMLNMTRCLRPGGIAVHTTEYNVSSNRRTLTRGPSVIFRRADLLRMKRLIEALGHQISLFDFHTGDGPADHYVDEPPYTHIPHLKLRLGSFVTTSIGIIVTVGQQPSWLQRTRVWLHSLVA